MKCELCGREVENYTVHHLIPKSKNGGQSPTAILCQACHRTIHRFYTNKELAESFYTIERLRLRPEIRRFVAWFRKQDPHKRIKVS